MAEKVTKHKSSDKTHNHSGAKAHDWPGGWFTVKRSIVDFFTNIVPWLAGLLAAVPLLLALLIQLIVHSQNAGSNLYLNLATAILGIVGFVLIIYVSICTFSSTPVYGLARADGKKMLTKDFYTTRSSIFWRLLGAELLFVLAIIAGLILLIVPGIVLFIWLLPAMSLVPYVIVEEELGVVDSIKRAHQLGKGHAGKVWGIIGWYFVIGLVLMIPIILLVLAVFGNNLHSTANSSTNNGSSNNSSGGSFGGGGPFTAISFAYLYRWIKKIPKTD